MLCTTTWLLPPIWREPTWTAFVEDLVFIVIILAPFLFSEKRLLSFLIKDIERARSIVVSFKRSFFFHGDRFRKQNDFLKEKAWKSMDSLS